MDDCERVLENRQVGMMVDGEEHWSVYTNRLIGKTRYSGSIYCSVVQQNGQCTIVMYVFRVYSKKTKQRLALNTRTRESEARVEPYHKNMQ